MYQHGAADTTLETLRFIEKEVPGYTYNDCLVSLLNLPVDDTHLRVNHFLKCIQLDEVYGNGTAHGCFNTLFVPLTRDVDIFFVIHSIKLVPVPVSQRVATDSEVESDSRPGATVNSNVMKRIQLYVDTVQLVQEIVPGQLITIPVFAAPHSYLYLRIEYERPIDLAQLSGVEIDVDVGFVQTWIRKQLMRSPHHAPHWTILSGELKTTTPVSRSIRQSVRSRRPYLWLPRGRVKILPGSDTNLRVSTHRDTEVIPDRDGQYFNDVSDGASDYGYVPLKVYNRDRPERPTTEDTDTRAHPLAGTITVVYALND